jgi:hypothetical protein
MHHTDSHWTHLRDDDAGGAAGLAAGGARVERFDLARAQLAHVLAVAQQPTPSHPPAEHAARGGQRQRVRRAAAHLRTSRGKGLYRIGK